MVMLAIWAGTMAVAGVPGSTAEAIDAAGMQRARAFKMLKYYVQIQSKHRYGQPEKSLQTITQRYEETQKDLRQFAHDPALVAALDAVDAHWSDYKKRLSQPCDPQQVNDLLMQSIQQKMLSNRVVTLMTKEAKAANGEEINRAGLLRATSQKIALLYLIKAWQGNQTTPQVRPEMDKAMEHFKASLDFLLASKQTSDAMKSILKRLQKTYLYFTIMNDSDVFTPALVLKKTDAMLRDAVTLVGKYVDRAAHKPEGSQ